MSSFKRAPRGTPASKASSSSQGKQASAGGGGRKLPKGTTPSLTNGQLLTSSGVKSLDYLLKGGLAIGTSMVIETGPRSSYSDVLLKYFLSEGICQNHYTTLISADVDPTAYLRSCPKTLDVINLPQNASIAPSSQGMQIAWRYKNLPKINTELGSGSKTTFSKKYQHTFNLKETIAESDLVGEEIHAVDLRPKLLLEGGRDVFEEAINSILEAVEPFIAEPTQGPLMSVTVHRIAVHNLGSASWWGVDSKLSQEEKEQDVARFLMQLRGIARRACCVFCVTLVDSVSQSEHVRKQFHMLSDVCIRMDGFGGTPNENNPVLREYHGFFKVQYLNSINSLLPLNLDVSDLAFKLKSTGLAIEKLHLPPDLSETVSRSQEDDDSGKSKKAMSAAQAAKAF